ncbi:MAG: PHP domain-containing protein [Gammaproteobacteria bacterium]
MNATPGSIDLHVHTTASDGGLAPGEVVARAAAAGVRVLSITDHDTVAAYSGLDRRAHDITLVPGIELSTYWRLIGVHVVGLGIDPDSTAMRDACASQQAARERRARAIAARLERAGIRDAYAGAARYAGEAAIGRPHFARHLVACGAARTLKQAYARFLRSPREVHGVGTWADLATVVAWIRSASGIAVLAHPAHYGLTGMRLDALAADFTACGGGGIEVVSGHQPAATTARLAALARTHGLLGSVGSDFHHAERADTALGRLPALPAGVEPVWGRWTADTAPAAAP